jgi:Domain of unknown function DUF302
MKRVINKVSHATVAETLSRLIAEVDARGMRLFTTIDHSGEARASGLELPETKLVIFGNPRIGTPIMQAAPLAGARSAVEGAGARGSVSYVRQLYRAGRARGSVPTERQARGRTRGDRRPDGRGRRSIERMPRLTRTQVRNRTRRGKLVALGRRNRREQRAARGKG